MAVQNPILDLLAKGGGAAIQGYAQAGAMGTRAAESFDKGASMALKMDTLLQQEEARLNNNVLKAQKNLQDGLNNALNAQFKQRSAKLAEAKFAESTTQFTQTHQLGVDRLQNTKDFQEGSLALRERAIGVQESTLAMNKKKYRDELKLKKDQMNFTNSAMGGTTTSQATAEKPAAPFAPPELNNPSQAKNYADAVKSLSLAARNKTTVTQQEVDDLKSKLDPKYHKPIDSIYKNMSKGSKTAPKTLSGSKSTLTEPQQREAIQNHIQNLRAQRGGVAGNAGQTARFDQQIKSLQENYKRLSPSATSMTDWANKKFKADPNMNKSEFVQEMDNYSRSQFFDKDDKSRFDKSASAAWDVYEKKQKEGAARRLGYESANQADAGTKEYNVNNNIALLTQRDEGLASLIPLDVAQATQNSAFGFMSDQSFLESGIAGLANNEQLAGQVTKQLMSSENARAAMGKTVTDNLRSAIKAGDEDKIEDILTKWLENPDTEAEIKKQYQLR